MAEGCWRNDHSHVLWVIKQGEKECLFLQRILRFLVSHRRSCALSHFGGSGVVLNGGNLGGSWGSWGGICVLSDEEDCGDLGLRMCYLLMGMHPAPWKSSW